MTGSGAAVLLFGKAGLEVDVGKGVEFGHHDVDVVGTDAVGESGDALAAAGAGDGVELAGLFVEFDAVEMLGDGAYAARVAHHYDDVGEVFGQDMEMEHGPVIVDDEFRAGDGLFVHGNQSLKKQI